MTIHLDPRGDIAIAEIIVYLPVLVVSGILVARHGVARKAGWIFLLILSLVRIIGGATAVAAEQNPSDKTLDIVSATLTSAGVSPLLLATIGFLGTVCYRTLGDEPLIWRGLRIMSLLCSVALLLAIVGGVKMGNAKTIADLNSANTLRHAGAAMFAVLFVLIFLLHMYCWVSRSRITKARRTLLASISLALPFLLIRVVYTVLSSAAPYTTSLSSAGGSSTTSNSPLSKFNSSTGSWIIYLLMSVLAEYAAVVVYCVAGTRIRLQDDVPDYINSATADYDDDRYKFARAQGPMGANWGR
ncbi:uncharacterized protein C8Q71DRAFT_758388 [Rhodofomes roseus]|uniref:DUF7702 domain-containing protein n=1 Tax=Rhodofomes roseus TaxID=34475 RepID=A0ABQ8KFH7_9APHY|nr:uncharacterized protein C8Q71DRAFT_758388 [Rhodofomes roseus]KAH9836536.1 hypothetical protein C8Q71DRAFT_758388 [Rhodofomes roseus]